MKVKHFLDRATPLRSVDDESHDETGDERSRWQGDEPTAVGPGDHSPVDSPPLSRAETNTDSSTDDALGGGDGEGKTGGEHNGDSSSQLHRETTDWRVESDAVTKVAHEVVSVSPETDGNCSSSEDENPDWHGRVLAGSAGLPDVVHGGQGSHSVSNVVGTVTERSGGSSQNLEERVQVLDLLVVVLDKSVLLGEVLADKEALEELGLVALSGLLSDDVNVHTTEEEVASLVPDGLWLEPLAFNWDSWGLDSWGNHVDRGVVVCVCIHAGLLGDAVDIDLSALKGLLIGSGAVTVGLSVELLLSQVTLVVIRDEAVASGHGTSSGALEEERTLDDLPGLDSPVLAAELDPDEWEEEDAGKESAATTDTEDGTNSGCDTPVVEVKRGGTLPDNQHGKNTRGQTEVERDSHHSPAERVRPLEHTILGEGEDDGTEATSNTRSDEPGGEHLGDTAPGPVNSVGADGRKTETNDTTD